MNERVERAHLNEILIQGQYALMSVHSMNAILAVQEASVAFFREAQSFLNQAAAILLRSYGEANFRGAGVDNQADLYAFVHPEDDQHVYLGNLWAPRR